MAVGAAFVAVGGILVGIGLSRIAGSHQAVWSSPWFDSGGVVVVVGVLLVVSTPLISWWHSRLRRPPTSHQGPESDAPVSDHGTSAASPLRLRLDDEDWRPSYRAVWALGLKVTVTNVTGKPIILVDYQLRNESSETQRPPLASEVWNSVNDSKSRLMSEHKSELFGGEITVPPGGSVTRWHIDTAYVPLPEGGRPHCTFQITDILDNTYELNIPARPSITFRSE